MAGGGQGRHCRRSSRHKGLSRKGHGVQRIPFGRHCAYSITQAQRLPGRLRTILKPCKAMKVNVPMFFLLVAGLIHAGCTTLPVENDASFSHRYFLEIDRPGAVYAVLENPKYKGAMIRLLEIDGAGKVGTDTLRAWVQHYSGRGRFPAGVEAADIIIACHRDLQPEALQARHVLPESTGEIFVYMMRGGVLVVSDAEIPYYEVLVAARHRR